jgi:hypothetical protein
MSEIARNVNEEYIDSYELPNGITEQPQITDFQRQLLEQYGFDPDRINDPEYVEKGIEQANAQIEVKSSSVLDKLSKLAPLLFVGAYAANNFDVGGALSQATAAVKEVIPDGVYDQVANALGSMQGWVENLKTTDGAGFMETVKSASATVADKIGNLPVVQAVTGLLFAKKIVESNGSQASGMTEPVAMA